MGRIEDLGLVADKGLEWKAKYKSAKEELLNCVQWQHDLRQQLAEAQARAEKAEKEKNEIRIQKWLDSPAIKTYDDLKYGVPGGVLHALQDGLISRGKAAQALAEWLHGKEPSFKTGEFYFRDDVIPADAHKEAIAERDALAAHVEALREEKGMLKEENDFMRLRLAESGVACVYCNLPASDMEKCVSGFPGCARADDLYECDRMTVRDAAMKRAGAAAVLRTEAGKLREISDRFGISTGFGSGAYAHAYGRSAELLEAEAERLEAEAANG